MGTKNRRLPFSRGDGVSMIGISAVMGIGNIVITALMVRHLKKMICLLENMRFSEIFAEMKYVICCLFFGTCYSVKNLFSI